jgi:hypothetical protein
VEDLGVNLVEEPVFSPAGAASAADELASGIEEIAREESLRKCEGLGY